MDFKGQQAEFWRFIGQQAENLRLDSPNQPIFQYFWDLLID